MEARVCAPPDAEFAELTARVGVALAPAFAPIREWVKDKLNRKVVDRAQAIAEVMAAQFGAIAAAAEGCDVLVFSGVFSSAAAARSVAEKLGIRHMCVAYCPSFCHHRTIDLASIRIDPTRLGLRTIACCGIWTFEP